MTRSTRPILCMPMAACLLTAVLAGEAAAQKDVPFKATIQSIETTVAVFPPEVPFPTLFVDGSGSGRATHLGRYTLTFEYEINLDEFITVGGSAHFVAANGDSLFAELLEGQGTVPTDDGISFIVATYEITGGTGRFAGATGSFTEESVINVITHVKFGSFDGSIRFGKAK
jgi:hypothetical protein